jgi:hypothetical protein
VRILRVIGEDRVLFTHSGGGIGRFRPVRIHDGTTPDISEDKNGKATLLTLGKEVGFRNMVYVGPGLDVLSYVRKS